jgi:hypothetical protein
VLTLVRIPASDVSLKITYQKNERRNRRMSESRNSMRQNAYRRFEREGKVMRKMM